MELSDASRRLIRWELRTDMQNHSCRCCDLEAGLHGQEPSTPILRQIDHRIRRVTQMLSLLLLCLIVVVGLLVPVLLGGRVRIPDKQATSPGEALAVSGTQQEQERPSAFLTAPKKGTNNGEYLAWETNLGIAHNRGFRYSGGNLTVLTDGFYSIAPQITFINKEGTCDQNLMLNMTVYYFTEQYPMFEPLLATYDTMCCTVGCMKSLFTSGIFFLRANTILRIKAVHPRHVTQRLSENEVFFGVHRLS